MGEKVDDPGGERERPDLELEPPDLALPDLDDGVLPVGVHRATLDEIERVFVHGAPFEDERAVIFSALKIYARLIWARFPDAILWVNGGFVTHKKWAAPHDVDVVVVVPEGTDYDLAEHPEDVSLWTLGGLSATFPSLVEEGQKLQPMGGLVDGFYAQVDNAQVMTAWRKFWQRLRRENEPDLLDAKGFVEVRNS